MMEDLSTMGIIEDLVRIALQEQELVLPHWAEEEA